MAMMAADPVFVDTNALLAAYVSSHPLHSSATTTLQSLDSAGAPLWISRQVVREYLATLTRPQSYAPPHSIAALTTQVGGFLANFLVAEDGPQVTANLLALLASVPTGGRQVHDANIVATMQTYGIDRLWMHSTVDFARYGARIVLIPL